MGIVVQKFGGTSVGTPEKIKNVAWRVAQTASRGHQVVVIVSAMGHTTDELIALYKQIAPQPDAREYDMLLSTGEQISAALLAMALEESGKKAVSLTGWQAGVITEDVHSKARIVKVKTDRLKRELSEGNIVVVTGFQGINSKGEITTIGRGGSDTSAVAIAAALRAEVCEIYTDVKGVYSADPRIIPEAKLLKSISYEEMMELASLGAQVLHPRSVQCGINNKIAIHVRSSMEDCEGTIVKEVSKMEMEKREVVSGVAHDTNVAKFTILQVPDVPGMAAKIFGALADEKINVDMVIQSEHQRVTNDISFTVTKADFPKAEKILKRINDEIGAKGVVDDRDVAKVSIVGVGMVSTPGVAAKMFKTLAEEKINIELISTSEIKVSCVVREKEAKRAVKALHKKFISEEMEIA